MGRPRIAFIDDDAEFEIPLFREAFGSRFDVVAATSLRGIKKALPANAKPDLFVLDMYFPAGRVDPTSVERLRRDQLELLPDLGEMRQAYTNFKIARGRLERVLQAHRQGAAGGIRLAKSVAREFPRIPIVFYSRKASAEDTLKCLCQENTLDVILKPTGADDADTIALTKRLSPQIARIFKSVISQTKDRRIQKRRDCIQEILKNVSYFKALRRR